LAMGPVFMPVAASARILADVLVSLDTIWAMGSTGAVLLVRATVIVPFLGLSVVGVVLEHWSGGSGSLGRTSFSYLRGNYLLPCALLTL
jgi:hypothetical protein